ncbi:MAG: glycine betaine ABC transporter substrate-binding protein [Bacillota bacterium]
MKKAYLFTLMSLLVITLMSGQVAGAADGTLVMGEENWPGIYAKNAVAQTILEGMGYEVEVKNVSDPIIHQSLTNGDIDFYLGSWMPAMSDTREEIEDDIELVQTNMQEGLYIMAVPDYVSEEGVTSFEDLEQYADKFDHKLYVGPTGWISLTTMEKAVDNDIYNLGDWEVITSSEPALMSQIKKSIKDEEWICFVAWKPHWMNHILDITYLKDPEGLWDSPESRVDTLARKGLKEDNPQAYKFLEQFVVDVEDNDQWIYEIGQEDKDPQDVADNWIKNNFEDVEQWLEGVETPDGEPAVEAVRASLGMN